MAHSQPITSSPWTRRSSQRALAHEVYREMVAARAPQEGPAAQNLTGKVRALYERSAVPVAEIARLAGVTERTIYKYAAKQRWTPRYRWSAAHPRRWRAGAGVAPVKGAGGRFIRRAEAGKAFAVGLKATDPAAAARAAAACRRAAVAVRAAQAKAKAAQHAEAKIRAIDPVHRALAELNRHRAACAKAGQPGLRDDDRIAQALVRVADIATARLQHLLAG